ncbi:MAG TPA: DUF2764 family protein [Chlamydiales bacterium]|nr:DUF2764 family protein [Chlamydiales bacterium]
MYYFLGALLPEISLGEEPEMRFSELVQLLREIAPKKHFAATQRMRRLIDLDNVRQELKDELHNPNGSLTQKEIEEALLNQTDLPEYVFEILGRTEDKKKQIDEFSEVFMTFFRTEAEREVGFLKRYFAFERAFRLCLLAFRAQKMQRNLQHELRYADHHDFLVRELPEFPFEMKDLADLLASLPENDPWAEYCAIARYRFDKIEDLGGIDPFCLTAVMSYMLRLMIAEEWFTMSQEKGEQKLNAMIGSANE